MNDFAVLILTHGRPDNIVTISTLKKCGYTGAIYLVVDNEDEKIDKYRRKYGDMVCVFDKKLWADKCDEGNNFDERRTITHARNASFSIAKKLGLKYFIQLDDDYTNFRYRYVNEYITRGFVKNIERYWASLIDFMKTTGATSVAMAQGGDFIGGEGSGMISNYHNMSRKCMNSFICNVDKPFMFVGAMNEDVNTYTTLGSRGALFLTLPYIGLEQMQTQSQDGGITDMYKLFGTYCKGFTTVMMMPSSVKVGMMGFTSRRLHHSISWGNTVPKIISDQYKK